MKHLVWSPEAEEEFAEAAEWYEQRAQGLGFQFGQEVMEICERIEENPKAFSTWPNRPAMRKGVLQRFPFVIVYEEREDRLDLLAVAHTSRRPGYWAARKT
jgi:Plasmid stabilisation system protein.